MRPLEESLAQYAACHRDRRNIATHFAGIPMIVFALVLAQATVSVPLAGITLTLAAVTSILACVYYVRLDTALGIAMAAVLFLMCAGASEITARHSTPGALAWAAGIFVAGWAIQFLGHRFEGLKPAFFDDARQFLIGPLFVCAEAAFLLGAKPQLRGYIEARVGPTVPRRDGRPLPATAPERG